jgi:dGTPase
MADFGGFEHNSQSLRIVDYLEHPFANFRGLNLTNVTRHCIAGHENRSGTTDAEFAETPQPPLEAQVVDICDEIAYISADLEDALAAGWIDEDILCGSPLWENAFELAVSQYPDARAIHHRIAAVRLIPQKLSADLVTTTLRNIQKLEIKNSLDIQNAPEKCAALSPEIITALRQLKQLLFQRVYKHPAKVEKDEIGAEIIRELFAAFVKTPTLLPARYLQRVKNKIDSLQHVTCDYIAGMTDRFCRETRANQVS